MSRVQTLCLRTPGIYQSFSFQVVEKKAKPHIQVDVGGGQTKTFAPEEISAMVLTKMKETAEAYLGKKVSLNIYDRNLKQF